MARAPMTLFWFRRDLRIDDNHGLSRALRAGHEVLPVFIYDTEILDGLSRDDARVSFTHSAIAALDSALRERGSGLRVFRGRPGDVFPRILAKYRVAGVYCNEDYEPYAIK